MVKSSEQKNADEQKELMVKFQMFEQKIQNLNQQLQAVEEAILEMSSLDSGLDEIKNNKGSEILSPLGRGVFVKTEIISEDLIVDIGNKNFVKKNISDTKKIIKDQAKKLEEIQGNLQQELEKIEKDLADEFQKAQKKFS